MGIITFYNKYFVEMADPRVKDWFLMNNCVGVIIIILIYYYFIRKFGPKFMEKRKPYDLTYIIKIYNIFQIVSCSFITVRLLYVQGYVAYRCENVDYSMNPRAIRIAEMFWYTFIVKLCELIETVFFILRKKYNQASSLHIYHHISTMIIAWSGTKYVPGGMGTFPIVLNCSVHVIMYTYYFLSTLGPNWQKRLSKWKKKLTIIQMVQFTLMLIHGLSALRPSCEVPHVVAYLFLPNVFFVFYMFYNFYKKAYTKTI